MKKVNEVSLIYFCVIVLMGITVSCSSDINTSDLPIEYLNIPDENFEAILIAKGIDSDGIVNQQMLKSDAQEITNLDLSNLEYGVIHDLTGIEGFTSLRKLTAAQHDIAQIDVSNNINLDTLNLAGNNLSSIDLSSNSKLVLLDLTANQLNSITGLTELSELKDLDLSWNYFENFNISSASLEILHMRNNDLNALNISAAPNLKNLLLTSNKLQSLEVLSNMKLETLLISDNELQTINLSANQNLTHLYITNNLLINLDVSSNLNLIDLKVDRNPNLPCIKILDGQNIPLISKSDHQELNTNCN
jgi:protein phosphatase 1 regulatory subunit 7